MEAFVSIVLGNGYVERRKQCSEITFIACENSVEA